MRLDRLLAQRGFGSRKEVQRLVAWGLVARDGVVLDDERADVPEDATLVVDGEASAPPPRLVAWHKPVGVLTTVRDPWGREGLDDKLPIGWREALHPVGRLDQDTSGLLLFSADGALTQRLLHPKRAVPRTYVATVEQVPPGLAEQLTAGVATEEGTFTGTVEAIDGLDVRLTVTEGKHRMVRRMLANAGAPVSALHRVAYGPVRLGDLPVGAFRVLDGAEEVAVRRATGLDETG
jgi:23S rRNA pseudouridine2605 synthase